MVSGCWEVLPRVRLLVGVWAARNSVGSRRRLRESLEMDLFLCLVLRVEISDRVVYGPGLLSTGREGGYGRERISGRSLLVVCTIGPSTRRSWRPWGGHSLPVASALLGRTILSDSIGRRLLDLLSHLGPGDVVSVL